MWATVRALLLLAILGIGGYAYRDQVRTFALQAYREGRPCTVPIPYRVGFIDPRFDTSTSSLVAAMQDAEALWEGAAGRELFVYEQDGGGLEVNLIFDERQATTQRLEELGVSVEQDLGAYESTQARYRDLLAQYENAKDAFEIRYARYERDAAAYERDVDMWNARGGAPEGAYAQLEATRTALRQEESQLRALQETVNRQADAVNALARRLNALARELNISVGAYNTVGQSVEGEFEEAVYESRPGQQKIDIFEFSSNDRLERVLAHEFGHAIGLEHVEDESAIMYRLNQSSNQSLTRSDISALEALCKIDG